MFIKAFLEIKKGVPHRLLPVCLVMLGFALTACGPDREGPSVTLTGSRAPDFAIPDLQGRTWTLDEVKGRVVLLRFWTDQCPYCSFEMPVIEKMYRRLKPAGLEVLAINIRQSPEVSEALTAQLDLTFPMLLDRSGRVAEKYRVSYVPANFLIDRQGILRKRLFGEAFREERTLKKFLQDQFPNQPLQ
jgi:cytochrome c biogenesis protein CcmG, thiol:disulfide interchange protein DsbE